MSGPRVDRAALRAAFGRRDAARQEAASARRLYRDDRTGSDEIYLRFNAASIKAERAEEVLLGLCEDAARELLAQQPASDEEVYAAFDATAWDIARDGDSPISERFDFAVRMYRKAEQRLGIATPPPASPEKRLRTDYAGFRAEHDPEQIKRIATAQQRVTKARSMPPPATDAGWLAPVLAEATETIKQLPEWAKVPPPATGDDET